MGGEGERDDEIGLCLNEVRPRRPEQSTAHYGAYVEYGT